MKFPLSLAVVLALTSTALAQELSQTVRGQIVSIQTEKAARTPAQRKLDSQLHYLSRETRGLRAVEGVPALKSRVPREKDGRVLVDISAPPSAGLRQSITDAGGTVIYESPRWNSVRASLPPGAFESLASRTDVKRIASGARPTAHTGAITNEASPAHRAPYARAQYGADGTGIKVGVISNSADHHTNSVSHGELPADFTVLPGRDRTGLSGEGTAMSEIVYDIAPGAKIFFATAEGGKAFFADSILALRSNGCHIIVDDISYPTEWQFQDDEIGQAINTVVADGAVYLSSSGNEGNLKRGNSTTWEGDFVDGGSNPVLPGGRVHSFGTQNYNRLMERSSGVTLQWSDEYHSSSNEYDLYILNAAGTDVVTASSQTQDGDDEPLEYVETVHVGERIVIFRFGSTAPRYLRISCPGSALEIQTAGQTIGHAATANCICVAASDASMNVPNGFTTSSVLEDSSSDGPHKMFYLPNGTPITPGNFLASGGTNILTPAITAGDGGATSVPGFMPFYGTSAAAPAAAAIAALVWSKKPSLSNAQVRAILEGSCLDIEDPGFEINSGHGILMANLALAKVTPTSIGASVNGANLTVSWPGDYTGWRLLEQINQLAAGISTNLNDWATVANSSATNKVTVAINPAKPTTFYRLIYP